MDVIQMSETTYLPFGKYKQGSDDERPMSEMEDEYLQWLAEHEPQHSNDFEVPQKFAKQAKKILIERGVDFDAGE